jgi:type I restriction enzyme M protein
LESLKSTGKGAVILPHGVLFRGNAESEIRKNIIERKWIKGIIGLPANLFYGTGIPACIIVLDKANTEERKGIFMIDASKGFIKDGNKNRLQEKDIHKIVDVFNSEVEVPKFSRFVPFEEIEKNEFNLNIPRYIDTQDEEDIQDLQAHLSGGIPNRDIDGLNNYWTVYGNLKNDLFEPLREGYSQLKIESNKIKETIFSHPEFTAYSDSLESVFTNWKTTVLPILNHIDGTTAPKKFIHQLTEALLTEYKGKNLLDSYSVYQHLMNYWNETLKDDIYLIVEDGWTVNVRRILEKNNKGKEVDKGWTCDLIPKELIIKKFLSTEQSELNEFQSSLESVQSEISQFEEEHTGDEGLLSEATNDKGSLTKVTVTKFIKDNKTNANEKEAVEQATQLLNFFDKEAELKKTVKAKEAELDQLTLEQFGKLTGNEVRDIVVDDKWLTSIKFDIQTEIDGISQRLTTRIKELGERYDNKLGSLAIETETLESIVAEHLQKMGLVWS